MAGPLVVLLLLATALQVQGGLGSVGLSLGSAEISTSIRFRIILADALTLYTHNLLFLKLTTFICFNSV